jgi:uncharacterized protein (DUF433 family)
MTTKTLDQHIETSLDIAGGKPRIAGHRITVCDIVMWHERLRKSVDEIASDYGLTLADVHAALAYYFDHRADIDKDMADGQVFAEVPTPSHALQAQAQAECREGRARRVFVSTTRTYSFDASSQPQSGVGRITTQACGGKFGWSTLRICLQWSTRI